MTSVVEAYRRGHWCGKKVSAKRSQWSLDHQAHPRIDLSAPQSGARNCHHAAATFLLPYSRNCPSRSGCVLVYYFGRIFCYFSKNSKAVASDIFPKYFDIFSKKPQWPIRGAAMHTSPQSGRLPTIVTQRLRIEGVAIFRVRMATLATAASWDHSKSITGGSIYLVLVFIYFRCRDRFALFEIVRRRCMKERARPLIFRSCEGCAGAPMRLPARRKGRAINGPRPATN
jgi:hypothetical protein